jgi:DNA replication protein DnaC
MELTQQITPQVQQLRRSGVLATREARHRQAIEGQWAAVACLERLLADAIERRAQPQLALRVRRATRTTSKTREGFEGSVHPTLTRQQVLPLASCDSIRQTRHVWRGGPTGVGKPHLAHARAHAACRQGCAVLFGNTHTLLQPLPGGRADGTWATRVALDLRPALRVLDDCGLNPWVDPAPADLYAVSTARDDVGSRLVTSHRAPTDWPDLFGTPLLASAGRDRLAHHAEMLGITGRSFRAQGRQPAAKPAGARGTDRR